MSSRRSWFQVLVLGAIAVGASSFMIHAKEDEQILIRCEDFMVYYEEPETGYKDPSPAKAYKPLDITLDFKAMTGWLDSQVIQGSTRPGNLVVTAETYTLERSEPGLMKMTEWVTLNRISGEIINHVRYGNTTTKRRIGGICKRVEPRF